MGAEAGGVPRRGRWRGWWWKLPLLFAGFSMLQVLVLRFVDPPFSAFMAARQLDALVAGDTDFRIAHDWRDFERMSPNLPLALVAGSTENATLVTELLVGLRERGLDLTRPMLVGIDGAKALRKAESDLRALTSAADYSEAKARALADSAAKALSELTLARARADRQVFEVLTPEQRNNACLVRMLTGR